MRTGLPRPATDLALLGRLSRVWTVAVLLFLYLPIGVLVAYSFNRGGPTGRWAGFTVAAYHDLWHERALMDGAKTSLSVAAASAVVATVLGTLGAWVGHRYQLRVGRVAVGRGVLSLAYVPIAMPDVVMGAGLFTLFAVAFNGGPAVAVNAWFTARGYDPPLTLGWGTLVASHITFCFPFVLVAVRARLAGLDPSLEEAAVDLGATPAAAFARVVLPAIWPAVLAGGLMAFTLSVDELIVSSYTRGTRPTLPSVIYGMARTPRPTLNAISAVFVVFTAVVMVIAEWLRRPKCAT